MRTIEEFNALWTEEVFAKLRMTMDPIADQAAESVFQFIGKDREKMKAYMIRLASLDFFEQPEPLALVPLIPVKLSAFFNNTDQFGLTDEEKGMLNQASLFFEANGPAIIMVLATRSLLKQYSSANTSELLGRTKLLEKFPHRRIIETMQFVMDVMEPDWFSENKSWAGYEWGSPAIHSIQKLRLIHAMVRTRVKGGTLGSWDAVELEEPVNQEDMMMANYTFSLAIIEGLKNLGIAVSDQERDNFLKAWQIIGRLLGIVYPEGLMPETYEEAWALQNRLYEHHFAEQNEHAPKLAEALINWMVKIIPFTSRKMILDLVVQINGKENISILKENLKIDFEGEDKKRTGGGIVGWAIQKFKSKSKVADRTFFQELFSHMINGLLGEVRGGKERRFRIYDGFDSSWDIRQGGDFKPINKFTLLWKMVKEVLKTLWHRLLNKLGIKID
jgi:hypothetical protein